MNERHTDLLEFLNTLEQKLLRATKGAVPPAGEDISPQRAVKIGILSASVSIVLAVLETVEEHGVVE